MSRVPGAGTLAVALATTTVLAGACSSPSTDGAGQHLAGPDRCQDVRVAPGALGVQLALGYATTSTARGGSTELRLCAQGLPHKVATIEVPAGVTVRPESADTGSAGDTVLSFSLTAAPGATGRVGIRLVDAAGHVTLRALGPEVVADPSGWRLVSRAG